MNTNSSGHIEISTSKGSKGDVGEGTDSQPQVTREALPPGTPLPSETIFKTGGLLLEMMKPSQVSVSLGLTKSLGNYEFARIDVQVTDSCEPDKKNETFERVYKLASEYVSKINADLNKGKAGS